MIERTPIPSAQSFFAIDGAKIKSIREAQKLTQLYVATCLEITVDTVSRWENGRSPNIKLENAEKLAEIFDISLADIEDSPPLPDEDEVRAVDSNDNGQATISKLWWVGLLGLLAVIGIVVFLLLSPSSVKIEMDVQRLLPRHASPQQPFPVVIRVQTHSEQQVSFILKEQVAEGCQVIEGEPPLMAVNQEGRFIKWLSQSGGDDTLYFAYLAQAGPDLQEGATLSFDGEVLVKGRFAHKQAIAGVSSLVIINYHWADANRDYVIDDEEILTIYNSFKVLKDLGVDIAEIQQIWASKGYRWNQDDEKFVEIP